MPMALYPSGFTGASAGLRRMRVRQALKRRCWLLSLIHIYEDFFAVLKDGGYDGRVSIEAYSENKEKEISGAVFIRKYF